MYGAALSARSIIARVSSGFSTSTISRS
jgi:hypothetical protein